MHWSPYTRHECFLPGVDMLISCGAWRTHVIFCFLEDLGLWVTDLTIPPTDDGEVVGTIPEHWCHVKRYLVHVSWPSQKKMFSVPRSLAVIHLRHDVSFSLHVGYVVAPSEHLLRYTLHRQDLPVPPAANLRRDLQS